MGKSKMFCEEAKEIIYRVYLYFSSEAATFKTDDQYFQKVRTRVSEATGVSTKLIYRLLKQKGLTKTTLTNPIRAHVVVKRHLPDSSTVHAAKISRASQKEPGTTENAEATTSNSYTEDQDVSAKKSDRVVTDVPKTVKLKERMETPTNPVTLKPANIGPVYIRRPNTQENSNSPAPIFPKRPNGLYVRHSSNKTLSSRHSAGKPVEHNESSSHINKAGLIYIKVKHTPQESDTGTYPIETSNMTKICVIEDSCKADKLYVKKSTLQNSESSQTEPGPLKMKIVHVVPNETPVHVMPNETPVHVVPIQYIKPDPDLIESNVVPIEYEPAIKQENMSDSQDSD